MFDIDAFLKTLTTRPGVYQMIDEHETTLYVGKAKNLKKRVTSYFKRVVSDTKTQVMVSKIARVDVTITQSDNEALLLESNLIKKLKPRYNVLLRDDKSYPYLHLTAHSDFARLDFHRGAKSKKGRYFGPYPSAGAVRETLTLLQKLFKLRQCSDSFFKNRTRPCLQYQIKRCTAPCVKYITPEDYQTNVHYAVLFLEGKNKVIIEQLIAKMDEASSNLAYEAAAKYRDLIKTLSKMSETQVVTREQGNVDVIAIAQDMGTVCVQIIFIRRGRVIGNRAYFPNVPHSATVEDVLTQFIPQFYLNRLRGDDLPQRILINLDLPDADWIENALCEQFDKKIAINSKVRGQNRQWLQMADTNAQHALASHNTQKKGYYVRLEALQKALHLANLPQRIECFDISHSLGEAAVGSCVVYTVDGPKTSDYRRFNIKDAIAGDDYGALKEVITRRYTRLKKAESVLPDVILIDGGKGQLHIAEQVLEDLQVSGVTILSIVKGPGRKPVYDRVFIGDGTDRVVEIKHDSVALHLLQYIRDEAHRFAITAHRSARGKKKVHSQVADIPGIGPKKRRDLLKHFGGLQELKRASATAIAKVPGIGSKTARHIYDFLHSD